MQPGGGSALRAGPDIFTTTPTISRSPSSGPLERGNATRRETARLGSQVSRCAPVDRRICIHVCSTCPSSDYPRDSQSARKIRRPPQPREVPWLAPVFLGEMEGEAGARKLVFFGLWRLGLGN